MTKELLKLNLGCGASRLPGFLNVDSEAACNPDMVCNLEQAWPWADNSVDTISMVHVLEHLGREPQTYLNIIKEMWRVCVDGALVHIVVPHHRHDNFFSDPTHVRPVTSLGLTLFDKLQCQAWQAGGYSNTPLALYCGVDFVIDHLVYDLDPAWQAQIDSGARTHDEVFGYANNASNVITQMRVQWRVCKTR
jgi:hypothetical protein